MAFRCWWMNSDSSRKAAIKVLSWGRPLECPPPRNPRPLLVRWRPCCAQRALWSFKPSGRGAVNQAVKAIAITRGFVAPNGIDLVAIPAFTKVEIDGEERTAIRFLVQ